MGQFSWCCGLCDQEVMHGRQPGYEWTKEVAILWPNGDIRRGVYEDGYGNIAGINLVDEPGGWRLVHQRCLIAFKPNGNGEFWNAPAQQLFAALKPDRHAQDQGWWPGERLAVERYGEPELSELTEERTYVCYECKRTWKAKWSGGICPFGCVRPKNYRDSEESIVKGWGDHREMVEPFHYLDYRHETADGVIVCRNASETRTDWQRYHRLRATGELDADNPPTETRPCFHYNEPQQVRVTKPEEWDEFEDDEPFVIRCRSCKSEDVEIMDLRPSDAA